MSDPTEPPNATAVILARMAQAASKLPAPDVPPQWAMDPYEPGRINAVNKAAQDIMDAMVNAGGWDMTPDTLQRGIRMVAQAPNVPPPK